MRTRKSKILTRLGIVACSVAAVSYFAPFLLYLAYRMGVPAVDQSTTLGVTVEMSNGWYPLASGDNWLGGRLVPKSLGPTVLFHRVKWFDPWSSETLWISKSKIQEPLDQRESSGIYREARSYPWGRAGIVKEEIGGVRARVLTIVPEHGLSISAENLDVLTDIKKITATTQPKGS